MSMAPSVWMKFRCELRARWLAWIALGLLVGVLVAGVTLLVAVIVAVPVARRTVSRPPAYGLRNG